MKAETVGVLLPARGRYESLEKSLKSLSESHSSNLLEVVIVADNDKKSFEIASEICSSVDFLTTYIVDAKDRLFPVLAFNLALLNCKSEIFFWTTNTVTYDEDWLTKSFSRFKQEFPDKIGVLAMGGKRKKANIGMSSRNFIRYNEGGWFWPGYTINFCDDELTCRAILLGRYVFLKDSGVKINSSIIEKELLFSSLEDKRKLKRADRGLFYKRTETNFGLNPEKIYEWKGFREINRPLKVKGDYNE